MYKGLTLHNSQFKTGFPFLMKAVSKNRRLTRILIKSSTEQYYAKKRKRRKKLLFFENSNGTRQRQKM